MKAWVLERQGARDVGDGLVLRDWPEPVVEEGEILIAVRTSGVCRGDVRAAHGEHPVPRLPIVLGHQAVGRVVTGSRRFEKDARVGVAWLHESCGGCADCFRGDENLCRNACHTGADADGGFAQAVKIPEAFAYEIPAALNDVEAASLLCPGTVAYRSMRQADVEEGESLGLYGFGACARLALQIAHQMGCHVHVVSANAAHRRQAHEAGAEWVGQPGQELPEPLDRAIVFSPRGEFLAEALTAVRWGGTVACAAVHMGRLSTLEYDAALVGERTLRTVMIGTRQDVEDMLTLAAEGGLRSDAETFAFDQLPVAMQRLDDGEVAGSAVLVLEDA